jgi:DNA-directed RNA polymerase subunit omega
MARITIEDCTDRVPNHFILVLMTAVRTKQIMRGSKPIVPPGENKPIVTALRELAAGHILRDERELELPAPPTE